MLQTWLTDERARERNELRADDGGLRSRRSGTYKSPCRRGDVVGGREEVRGRWEDDEKTLVMSVERPGQATFRTRSRRS